MPATVERLEYDPNRTAFIALIKYEDGEQAYILAPQRLAPGDSVIAGEKADVKPGNAMPLASMPVGTIVHNVEMKPGKGGQIARSAGTYVQLVGRDAGYAILRLNSGETAHGPCRVHGDGRRGVEPRQRQQSRSARPAACAGRAASPLVRGVAMNPVDHPHGGGEGRTSGGRHPVTPWGKPTKGKRTRTNKATDKFILRSRHAEEEEVRHVARSVWKGPFVDGYLLKKAEKARGRKLERRDQDLVAPLDHPAAVRRSDLRRPQRPEAHPGARHRGHGRPQVR